MTCPEAAPTAREPKAQARPDSVVRLGGSLLQHGPANSRVYLMKLDEADLPEIIERMDGLAREHGYTKLFARVPGRAEPLFASRGFDCEARVPGLFRGRDAGCFMSRYLSRERAVPRDPDLLEDVRRIAREKARAAAAAPDAPDAGRAPGAADVVRLGPDHAPDMARLYGEVFASYPFPINDPAYLRRAMDADVAFYGIERRGRLASAASAEIDRAWACAEMTDFATRPGCRGKGAAGRLLARMEAAMRRRGIRTAYTIARAEHPGINAVFARAGYRHAGTLPNNTQIGGRLESMNVWYKPISG
ncbi:putative beta-lysine N-acetyltransferase [Desulfovibrio sp. X2]|uniref:putative beta-lysine N-acetyltransferase n=1 Tax=Desulfovibrio sp. X2 TaxID=941449 RepID=UPI0003589DFD|nr:putative beta-lysine N-acetyltransferase [Desulfovibrio sp. X2]EPR43475.1 putative beta-lysine N-acetyltransferase [Desulfovibrio sp. X2]